MAIGVPAAGALTEPDHRRAGRATDRQYARRSWQVRAVGAVVLPVLPADAGQRDDLPGTGADSGVLLP